MRDLADLAGKVALGLRVLGWYAVVQLRVQAGPLPDLVQALNSPRRRAGASRPHWQLRTAVDRVLRFGPHRPRCLVKALVLYRLLRAQGDEVELVIGLRPDAADHEAHAWVELGGLDLGPSPGRGPHVAMARYT